MNRSLNPLSLAIMALLGERPMHPYEIAFTMRKRRMADTIKLNFGSLYHTVETLQRAGLIAPAETEREGRRPERTVYTLTTEGRDQFLSWLRDLIGLPEKEYSRFEAGLCFLPHLPPAEAVSLLKTRIGVIEREYACGKEWLDALLRDGLNRLFILDAEHAQILRQTELRWIKALIEDIERGKMGWPTEGGCLPTGKG